MLSVRMDVLFSYYLNDQTTALQVAFSGAGSGDDAVRRSGIDGFWRSILIFAMLVTADITRTLLDLYLMQYFIVRWRVWLTNRLTGDWLDQRAYYRGRFVGGFGGTPIDNPDQRIQQDIDVFTTGTGPETNTPTVATAQTLLFGSVYAIVSVVAFTPILWNLAGPVDHSGHHGAQGVVLDRAAVGVDDDSGGDLDRPTDDPPDVPQFADQCGVPVRAGARPRRRRGGRLLSRRTCRTRHAGRSVRQRHRELPEARRAWRRLSRLEQVHQPDHRPAAADHPGAPVVRGSIDIRRCPAVGERVQQGAEFVELLPLRVRRVRRIPGRDHPARRPCHRERTGKGATTIGYRGERQRRGRARGCRGAVARR